MPIKDGLEQIEEIIRSLKHSQREERLSLHGTILTILSQIDKVEQENPVPNYKIYKNDLLTSVEFLCELDGGDPQEGEHIGRSLLAVRKMASYSCFNVNHHYI